MYSSIAINGSAADGYSSGDAIKAIHEVAEQTLPRGYDFEFSGITREENNTTNRSIIIFVICIVLVYLILCAFYESIFIPIAVIISVPCGLMGSFLFAKLFELDNNIYLQTGIIMLIGLLATGYSDYRICHQTPQSRNEPDTGRHRRRKGPFTSYTYDCINHDFRYDTVNVL